MSLNKIYLSQFMHISSSYSLKKKSLCKYSFNHRTRSTDDEDA